MDYTEVHTVRIMEITMEKKWYVVHTYSGYEQKVKELLEENIKMNKMDEHFGEIVVPF